MFVLSMNLCVFLALFQNGADELCIVVIKRVTELCIAFGTKLTAAAYIIGSAFDRHRNRHGCYSAAVNTDFHIATDKRGDLFFGQK